MLLLVCRPPQRPCGRLCCSTLGQYLKVLTGWPSWCRVFPKVCLVALSSCSTPAASARFSYRSPYRSHSHSITRYCRRGGVPFLSRFMMGQDMGVVAVVDSLAVLREKSVWRQNPADLAMPSMPAVFKLAGEHVACGLSGGWSCFSFLCFANCVL